MQVAQNVWTAVLEKKIVFFFQILSFFWRGVIKRSKNCDLGIFDTHSKMNELKAFYVKKLLAKTKKKSKTFFKFFWSFLNFQKI